MTEIGFQKTGDHSVEAEEFAATYERVDGRELTAVAEGTVQDKVEQDMLNSLRQQLLELEQGLDGNSVVVVESEQGKDYPKTREKSSTKVVGHENKLHFERYVEPPLRVAIYRKR